MNLKTSRHKTRTATLFTSYFLYITGDKRIDGPSRDIPWLRCLYGLGGSGVGSTRLMTGRGGSGVGSTRFITGLGGSGVGSTCKITGRSGSGVGSKKPGPVS